MNSDPVGIYIYIIYIFFFRPHDTCVVDDIVQIREIRVPAPGPPKTFYGAKKSPVGRVLFFSRKIVWNMRAKKC